MEYAGAEVEERRALHTNATSISEPESETGYRFRPPETALKHVNLLVSIYGKSRGLDEARRLILLAMGGHSVS